MVTARIHVCLRERDLGQVHFTRDTARELPGRAPRRDHRREIAEMLHLERSREITGLISRGFALPEPEFCAQTDDFRA